MSEILIEIGANKAVSFFVFAYDQLTKCGDIKYTLLYVSGDSLPNFISFDSQTSGVKISAVSDLDEGSYLMTGFALVSNTDIKL